MDTATLIILALIAIAAAWFVLMMLVAFAPLLILAGFVFAAFILFSWPGAIVALIVLFVCWADS
jgi:hypothetical protein